MSNKTNLSNTPNYNYITCINRGKHNYQRFGELREKEMKSKLQKERIIIKGLIEVSNLNFFENNDYHHFYECVDCKHYALISNYDWKTYYA